MLGPNGDSFDGVAFDLDDCREPETGQLDPWAQGLVDRANSYTEVTPSGNGLRIIGRGNVHELHASLTRPDGGHVEVYSQANRYITVTGDRLNGTPDQLRDLSGLVLEHIAEKEGCSSPSPELTTTPATSSAEDSDEGSAGLSDWLNGIDEPGNWHNSMIRAVASMVARGYSDPEILAFANRWTQPGYDVEQTLQQIQNAVDSARRKGFDANIGHKEVRSPAIFSPFTIDGDFNPAAIKARPWQVMGLTLRGHITLLVSPGGVGKSVLAIVIGIAVALRRNMIPDRSVVSSGNVLILNSEDDDEEILRRVAGVLEHYDIAPSQLTGKLFVQSFYGISALLAKHDAKEGNVSESELFAQLVAYCVTQKIELIVVDPLVGFHDAPENDNNAMEKVVTILRRLARDTGAAVVVVHHTRKTQASADTQAGEMDASRGASAVPAAARISVSIARMSKKEIKKYGIDPSFARNLRRIDDAKQNYAPPAEDVSWFEMRSVKIANGERVGVPVSFDISAIAERRAKEQGQIRDQRLWEKTVETATIIVGKTADGVERQPEALARYRAMTGCGQSTAHERFRLLPIGEDGAFRFTFEGSTRLIWRDQTGTDARPNYDVHWKTAPEPTPADGGIAASFPEELT